MTAPAEPTVFVVDDDEAVRKMLRLLMQSVQLPVETFASAQEFLEGYDSSRPGCLVLDVRMPGMSGMELQTKLARDGSVLPIIILTGHGDVPMAVKAVKQGALDFLEKPFRESMLIERVREALRIDARLRQAGAELEEIRQKMETLTPRESEVLDLVVAGKNTKQIAAQFGVSVQAVAAHRERLMRKMAVDSVAELVTIVLKARANREQA